MSEIIEVAMGDLYIAQGVVTLTTSSIGSCVAVCLYSSNDRAGGLAHIMLPSRPASLGELTDSDKKYADIAIALMVNELEKNGIQRDKIIAKLVGGANMFPNVQGRSHKMGERNVEAVKNILSQLGVRTAAENIGGNSGRSLSFDLSNGIVTIKVTI